MFAGGASANSATRSTGFHHEVSISTFGCAGSTRHSHARSEIAACARISVASGWRSASRTVFSPERGDAAPGVDQDRHAALVRERHQLGDGGLVHAEPLGARVQLDAARACVERARASPSAPSCGLTRQNATSRSGCTAAAASTTSFAAA